MGSRSWIALTEAVTDEQRFAAMEKLLQEREGWWGDLTLYEYVLGVCQYEIRRYREVQSILEADDIATEVVMALCKNAGSIRDPHGWVRVVVRRLLINHARKQARHPYAGEQALGELQASGETAELELSDALDAGSLAVRLPELLEAIEKLPEQQKTAFQLVVIQGIDRTVVAKEMKITAEALRQNLSRATRTLKRISRVLSTS